MSIVTVDGSEVRMPQDHWVEYARRANGYFNALRVIADRGCTNSPKCSTLPEGSWICASCIARRALKDAP